MEMAELLKTKKEINYYNMEADKKVIIAVSACLMGDNVRYDGKNKKNECVFKLIEENNFEVLRVCPEVGIKMGVPRAPIQLVKFNNIIAARGVDNPDFQVTRQLKDFVVSQFALFKQISGLVVKARSPSCGYGTTPLLDEKNKLLEYTDGIFTAAVREIHPDLPVVDELCLAEKHKQQIFIEQVCNYQSELNK